MPATPWEDECEVDLLAAQPVVAVTLGIVVDAVDFRAIERRIRIARPTLVDQDDVAAGAEFSVYPAFDLQHGTATGAARQLKEDYVDQGQVRFVFRHLAFLGDESTWAAEASECANEQGRFWDYHDKLFDEQSGENQGAYSKDNLKRFAADLGLDTGQFNECLDSGKYRSVVQDEIGEAQQRRISSTPSVLVNGQLVQNWNNYQALQAAIEAALGSQ